MIRTHARKFRKVKRANKLFKIISIIFFIAAAPCITCSQNSKSPVPFRPPAIILELTGSFNVPVGSTRGEIIDFFKFQNYGLVHGIGFDFRVKVAANKSGTIFPFLSAGFVHLQNDDPDVSYIDSNIIQYGYPLSGSQVYGSTPGTSLLVLRSMHVGLGLQYMFSSRGHVLPFISGEFNYNYIWGLYEQKPRLVEGTQPTEKTTFDINKTERFGIGFDMGLDYRMTKRLGFVFGARYKIDNLFGKKSVKTSPADLNKMNLLDAAAAELNPNLNKNRNISYLQFYVGFTVFAGQKK